MPNHVLYALYEMMKVSYIMNKAESGSLAKLEGHKFEHVVAEYLTENLNIPFETMGDSKTKVDVHDASMNIRLSVKNPSGKNTQVSLITQNNFIAAMGITDKVITGFIHDFFGGNHVSEYPRHRMAKSDIDADTNDAFVKYLNDNKSAIFDLIVSTGYNRRSNVNYMIFARTKNVVDNIFAVNIADFKDYYMDGEWTQNETTFEFNVNGNKLFHLQMKGSGKKYTNSYHAMMFHIYGANIIDKYVEDVAVLESVLHDNKI